MLKHLDHVLVERSSVLHTEKSTALRLRRLIVHMEGLAVHNDPDPQTRRRKIHCKQELIINSLQKFYSDRNDKDDIMKLLEGTSVISLRLIDWFVTNYARQHTISYILNSQEFLVYMNYKSQLKAYSKKLFDPFCRRERIMFQIPGHEQFLTTVGKLNFFRWAIEKGIINYIQMNLAKIEKEMNASTREINNLRKQDMSASSQATSATNTTVGTVETKASTRRRNRLTTNNTSNIIEKHELNVNVTFD